MMLATEYLSLNLFRYPTPYLKVTPDDALIMTSPAPLLTILMVVPIGRFSTGFVGIVKIKFDDELKSTMPSESDEFKV